MLKSIELQNFRSFGRMQSVPLEPLTAFVGANGSGKSSAMWVPRLIKRAVAGPGDSWRFPLEHFHQPSAPDAEMVIGWTLDKGRYTATFRSANGQYIVPTAEEVTWEGKPLKREGDRLTIGTTNRQVGTFGVLRSTLESSEAREWLPAVSPIINAQFLHPSVDVIRQPSDANATSPMGELGENLAALIAAWRLADPERTDALNDLVKEAIPEVRAVLVRTSTSLVAISSHGTPQERVARQLAGDGSSRTTYSLAARMDSGVTLEAEQLSDGVLVFIAICALIINAGNDGVVFLEEPEQGLHPSRLSLLMDLLRRAVHERQCQIVVSTHSPLVLNELRDQPEAVVLFDRHDGETTVRRLSDVESLRDELTRVSPGDLMLGGFFQEAR